MLQIPQQLVIGLTQGSIYALIALGYTLVYGVLRLINFAHGDVYMLGAYAGLIAAAKLGASDMSDKGTGDTLLLCALIFAIAMVVCAASGIAIERLAYRPLRTAPRLAALITAIGVSMLLEYGGQAVFTPTPQTFPAIVPDHKLIDISRPDFKFTFTVIQLVIISVTVGLMCALTFIVLKTRIGRAMRAVSLDQKAASLMGINTNMVIAFTFALGSALAAAGGVLGGVYQGQINPLIGLMVGLKAFVAAVLGGIGSIPGAAIGGLVMGLAETGVVVIHKSQYRDAIAFAVLILVLLFRPAGIMGRTSAEKV